VAIIGGDILLYDAAMRSVTTLGCPPNRHFDKIKTMKSEDALLALGALAQESRLTVFRLLVKRGPDGFTPSELAEKTGIPAPTLSFHLKELQRSCLVGVRREGRFLYYNASFSQMQALIGFLTEKCCSLSDVECDSNCAPVAMTAKRRRA
jgi:DNA-binding transcriptional ArsR family regulator